MPQAANFPWDKADLTIKLPRSKWVALGVTSTDGKPLPNDELPASLLLPMGRMGPAFLAYPNFAAYTEWNNSLIYSTTAGYLAGRIAGAPPMRGHTRRSRSCRSTRSRSCIAAGARRLRRRQDRRRAGPGEPHRSRRRCR